MDSDRTEVFAFPISCAQERLWFLEQVSPGTAMLNLNQSVRRSGKPDLEILERSLAELVRRHEALRTCFRVLDGRPMQVVVPEISARIEIVELDLGGDAHAELRKAVQAQATTPFDLQRAPLFRFAVVQRGDGGHVLSLTMHHLISDGWSLGLFWQELSVIARALASGQRPPLADPPIQYPDFTVWQHTQLAGPAAGAQIGYWREQLRDLEQLELPTDWPRPPIQSFRGRHAKLRIGPEAAAEVHALAAEEGATTFMVLLAAFQLLLSRYTQQTDIAVGSYVAGRSRPEVEGLIGLFLNTVVLRSDLAAPRTFRQLLAAVRETTLEAYANQDVPFARLVQELHPERNDGFNPYFQTIFQMINVPTLASGKRAKSPLMDVESGTSLFDLTCTTWETADAVAGHLEYNSDLFEPATIERLAAHFSRLVTTAASRPDAPLRSLSPIGDEERRRIHRDACGPVRPVAPDDEIWARFAARTTATPNAIAFICDDIRQSYAELAELATRWAHALGRLGVQPSDPVGVCLTRGLDSPAATLAVLRCGAVYVPLNPSESAERLAGIAADAGIRAVVTDAAHAHLVDGVDRRLILDHDSPAGHSSPPERDDDGAIADVRALPSEAELLSPVGPACVLYTSGSTGSPKGTTVSHSAILSRLIWMWETYPFAPGEVSCHKTAISFIDSLWELLGPLLAGSPTVIVPETVAADPDALLALLARERVTRIWLVPSLLRALLRAEPHLAERVPSLRFWVSSGEPLTVELLREFQRQMGDAALHNLYGTSEVWDVTWWDPSRGAPAKVRVPIGAPIDNRSAHVLDSSLSACPVGVPGELFVGGIDPLQGYLNRPALTAERFVPNPFPSLPGERLFATRDRARRLPGGEIEILGRLDDEVKIRGIRVELGEVARAVEAHPGVDQAVVVLSQRRAEPCLVAHVATADPITAAQLRRFLRDRLPGHAIPSECCFYDQLPLTSTGKVAREQLARAVPPDTERANDSTHEPPAGELESVVHQIWSEVLRLDEIGVTENFFDVGGHSVLLLEVCSRIRQTAAPGVSVNDLFRFPTIRALADHLDAVRETVEV